MNLSLLNCKDSISDGLRSVQVKSILAIVLVLILGLLGWSVPAQAADTINGAQIFEVHCAGCHINGGNIVRRGKNLKLKTLQRNSMDSIEAIAQIVTYGKNNMSAYADRLNEEQIQAVSAYVLEQAERGWKS
jgi:cytochrome c6